MTADGSPQWLDALTDLYHLCIYTVDAPADPNSVHLQVPANRGHEAMVYLTFLIDNYEHLPEAMLFVHGTRWSWHNDASDYDNVPLLKALNISAALAHGGYHNLRCDWSASTCPLETPAQGSFETRSQAVLAPWDLRAVSDAALPRALAGVFGGGEDQGRFLLGQSDALRSQCCAQFVVSRANVWQHTRGEFVALRQWLLDGSSENKHSSSNAAPSDDRVAGRILSYMWHILFLNQVDPVGINLEQLNSQACPRADECYCRLYGRCNLEHCSPGSCYGEYRLPSDYKLPDDWAATHS